MRRRLYQGNHLLNWGGFKQESTCDFCNFIMKSRQNYGRTFLLYYGIKTCISEATDRYETEANI
jgi:hypothetical protein